MPALISKKLFRMVEGSPEFSSEEQVSAPLDPKSVARRGNAPGLTTQIGDGNPNPAEKHIKHYRNQSLGSMLHVLDSKLDC